MSLCRTFHRAFRPDRRTYDLRCHLAVATAYKKSGKLSEAVRILQDARSRLTDGDAKLCLVDKAEAALKADL